MKKRIQEKQCHTKVQAEVPLQKTLSLLYAQQLEYSFKRKLLWNNIIVELETQIACVGLCWALLQTQKEELL